MKTLMKSNLNSFPTLAALALSAVLITGCATSAQRTAMVPTTVTVQNRHTASVVVRVTRTRKGDFGEITISPDDFQSALCEALAKAVVFNSVNKSDPAEYLLEVDIIRADQPPFGLNMKASLSAEWKLTRLSDHHVVLRDVVTGSHTATMGDAFVGAVRVRLATEGAVRETIKEGIERLSRLDLAGSK